MDCPMSGAESHICGHIRLRSEASQRSRPVSALSWVSHCQELQLSKSANVFTLQGKQKQGRIAAIPNCVSIFCNHEFSNEVSYAKTLVMCSCSDQRFYNTCGAIPVTAAELAPELQSTELQPGQFRLMPGHLSNQDSPIRVYRPR